MWRKVYTPVAGPPGHFELKPLMEGAFFNVCAERLLQGCGLCVGTMYMQYTIGRLGRPGLYKEKKNTLIFVTTTLIFVCLMIDHHFFLAMN